MIVDHLVTREVKAQAAVRRDQEEGCNQTPSSSDGQRRPGHRLDQQPAQAPAKRGADEEKDGTSVGWIHAVSVDCGIQLDAATSKANPDFCDRGGAACPKPLDRRGPTERPTSASERVTDNTLHLENVTPAFLPVLGVGSTDRNVCVTRGIGPIGGSTSASQRVADNTLHLGNVTPAFLPVHRESEAQTRMSVSRVGSGRSEDRLSVAARCGKHAPPRKCDTGISAGARESEAQTGMSVSRGRSSNGRLKPCSCVRVEAGVDCAVRCG